MLSTAYGELKSSAQADSMGRAAGDPFDSCYRTACDIYLGSVELNALERMTNAVLYGLWEIAK